MEKHTYAALSDYMDLLLDAVCVVDKDGHYVYLSAGFERIFGYSPEEMIGKPMIQLVHPDDRELTLRTARETMSSRHQPHFENRYLRKDGQVVHVMWSARWSEAHQVRIAVARDITRRKHAESVQAAVYAISEAAHTNDDLHTLFERIHRVVSELLPATNFAIALYDHQTRAVSFPYHVDTHSHAPAKLKLDSTALCLQVIDSGETLLLSRDNRGCLSAAMAELVGEHGQSWLGVPLKSSAGIFGALVVQSYDDAATYSQKDGELLQFVSTQIAAAIERKQLLDRLQTMALYDQLTQLPNRELFHDRIQSALARARRRQGLLALLYLDLDRFKEVNDSRGHEAGDKLLQQVARRLLACVRESDTVARFGGDEFVILLENIRSRHDPAVVTDKIRAALSQPFVVNGHPVWIVPSIGCALFPDHGDDEKALLRCADEAMYRIKRSARPTAAAPDSGDRG